MERGSASFPRACAARCRSLERSHGLARMPREVAAVRLTALIEALPNTPRAPSRQRDERRRSRRAAAEAQGRRRPSFGQRICGNWAFSGVTGSHGDERLRRRMLVLFTMSALFSGWPRNRRHIVSDSRPRRRDGRAEQIEKASGAGPAGLGQVASCDAFDLARSTQPHSAGAMSFKLCATRSTPGGRRERPRVAAHSWAGFGRARYEKAR